MGGGRDVQNTLFTYFSLAMAVSLFPLPSTHKTDYQNAVIKFTFVEVLENLFFEMDFILKKNIFTAENSQLELL